VQAALSVCRDALVQSLTSDERCSVPGGHFISIRAKRGEVRVVCLLRNSSDGEAVELNPLRPQDIEDRICNFVFGQKPLFLYGTTLDGNSIVWDDSSDAPPTPLEDLGPMGPIISSEGLIFTDIRQIFEPHEGLDSPVLLRVLKQMLQDGSLLGYTTVEVPGRPLIVLYHPFFPPYSLLQLSEEHQDGNDQADTSGDDRHDGAGGGSGCCDFDSSGSDECERGENDDGGGSGGISIGGIREDIDDGCDGSRDNSSDTHVGGDNGSDNNGNGTSNSKSGDHCSC